MTVNGMYVIVGERDFPYGICYPWARGGWGLDTLGKFVRRRCRRRPPRGKAGFEGALPLQQCFNSWRMSEGL